jgi:hypothetical protein
VSLDVCRSANELRQRRTAALAEKYRSTRSIRQS